MEPIQKYLDDYQHRGYYPGAVAVVSFQGDDSIFCSGSLSPELPASRITADTLFDVASLTKPVVTATAVLQLIDKGYVSLDDPVSLHLSEWEKIPQKQLITIKHLLTHTSGLPAWKPLYTFGDTPQHIMEFLAECPLNSIPGQYVDYSCLGFILLAELVRRLTGNTLAGYASKNIFKPLGMVTACFNPSPQLRSSIAPTEMGNEYEKQLSGDQGRRYRKWRRHRLWGEVQDGNSFALNGEGGNAGLFCSARDLLKFSTFIMNSKAFIGQPVISASLLSQATRSNTSGLNADRGLGWQMASSTRSCGEMLSSQSFGHNGFSGTSMWLDPVKNLTIILLTNRSFYGGDGSLFGRIRAPFHDLVVRQILTPDRRK